MQVFTAESEKKIKRIQKKAFAIFKKIEYMWMRLSMSNVDFCSLVLLTLVPAYAKTRTLKLDGWESDGIKELYARMRKT